jgi:hypothetical protein
MPESANFSAQNALKLTYKHPEIKKIFGLAIARHKGEKKGQGRDGGEKTLTPPSFLPDRRPRM